MSSSLAILLLHHQLHINLVFLSSAYYLLLYTLHKLHLLLLSTLIVIVVDMVTDYWGGWACFCVSILVIGVLTALIGDLASSFGCTIGMKDAVTAISFVALGTSLPGKSCP